MEQTCMILVGILTQKASCGSSPDMSVRGTDDGGLQRLNLPRTNFDLPMTLLSAS